VGVTIQSVTDRAYYHCAKALYRREDQIQPGNWGRLVLGMGPDHSFFYREYMLERVRASEFRKRPSRLTCAFLFADATYAHEWAVAEREFVYLARPLDDTEPCRLDMSWLTIIREYRTFEGVEGVARSYWSGVERSPREVELLVTGPIVIVDRITPIPENGVTH
jgi:hypothetical protein